MATHRRTPSGEEVTSKYVEAPMVAMSESEGEFEPSPSLKAQFQKHKREKQRKKMDREIQRLEEVIWSATQVVEVLKKRRAEYFPDADAGPSDAIRAAAASQSEPCMQASGLQPFAVSNPSGPPFQEHQQQ